MDLSLQFPRKDLSCPQSHSSTCPQPRLLRHCLQIFYAHPKGSRLWLLQGQHRQRGSLRFLPRWATRRVYRVWPGQTGECKPAGTSDPGTPCSVYLFAAFYGSMFNILIPYLCKTDRDLYIRPRNARSCQAIYPSSLSVPILLLLVETSTTILLHISSAHPSQCLARLRKPELGVCDVHLPMVPGEHTAKPAE